MKLQILKKTLGLLFVCYFWVSCYDNLDSEGILREAQSIIDQDPEKSLDLLNSITNPEAMKQDDYMQYVVSLIEAKFETQQDISKDTIIYEAQKYFESTKETKQQALANFYGGLVSLKNNDFGRSITSFIQAETNAQKIEDYELAGRSSNNIGYLYYSQNISDSAIVYYKKALVDCEKIDNADEFKLNIITLLGRVYEEVDQKSDLAYDAFSKALDLAINLNKEEDQVRSKNNIGWILYNKKEYTQAEQYLTDALSQTKNLEDSLRIYLNLATVYNATHMLNKAQQYCNFVQSRISESSDKYVLRAAYLALSNYHKEAVDYQKALYYSNLRTQINEEINKENQALKLKESSFKLLLQQKQKDLEKTESLGSLYMSFIIGSLALLGILSVLYLRSKENKTIRNLNEEDKLQSKYRNKIQKLLRRQTSYSNTMVELIDYPLPKTAHIKEKEEELNRTQQIILDMKERTKNHLLNWAKDHLAGTSAATIVHYLEDEDILVLALLGNRYTEKEIVSILDIPHELLYLKKLELRNLLEIRGFQDEAIDKLLFIEDTRIFQ